MEGSNKEFYTGQDIHMKKRFFSKKEPSANHLEFPKKCQETQNKF